MAGMDHDSYWHGYRMARHHVFLILGIVVNGYVADLHAPRKLLSKVPRDSFPRRGTRRRFGRRWPWIACLAFSVLDSTCIRPMKTRRKRGFKLRRYRKPRQEAPSAPMLYFLKYLFC